MRRRLSVLLVPALVAGLLSSPVTTARAEDPEIDHGAITVKAGYGQADATWHVGAGAGQYSSKSPDNVVNSVSGGDVDPHGHSIAQKDSYGVQSRLSYRAIVVEDGEGDQVAFVKSDSYLAQDYLSRRVGQILTLAGSDVSYDEIFHMASHNHSSPYYMTPSWGVWIFQDAFDIRAFEYHARAMADAIMEAESNLVPARMGATTVEHKLFKGMIARKGIADDGTPRGYPDDFGDLGLPVIRFDSLEDPANPQPIATMINWGQHPEGLDGHDLITGDFVASLERFVERATGAPLVFGQGDVGSGEAGPGFRNEVAALGIPAKWSHFGHAQGERGGYLLAQDVVKGWNAIAANEPSPEPYTSTFVPFSADFDVEAGNTWVAGPVSHPHPSVSNCRSEPTAGGRPGVPIVGLPDCGRPGGIESPTAQLWQALKEAGVPLPEHYDAPSYSGVQENLRLKLQAFKLGEVLLASCACEVQVDLVLNLESRTNKIQGDIWDGYDWTERMDCTQAEPPDGDWTCRPKADEPRSYAVLGPHTFSDYKYRRMLAQIHNDADGWNETQNAFHANSEPHDPEKIWGNFTKFELAPEHGYKLPIAVGHAGDYNGYTVSYREYMGYDHYRKALTSHGPHTADYMASHLVQLAGRLNGAEAPLLEADEARGLPDEARQVAMSSALGATSFGAYEAWYRGLPNDAVPEEVVVSQPEDIKRFDAATFSWVGGSNAVDNPTVIVERLDDGEWELFADQSGEVQTRIEWPKGANAFRDTYSGNQQWVWTANLEAFNANPKGIGSTPEGEYRFVVDGVRRRGGSDEPYELISEPFEVTAWDGVVVDDVVVHEDGSVSFGASSDYPRTYSSVFPYVTENSQNDELGRPFCTRCSFRPWATKGEVVSAEVVVVREDGSHERVAAQRDEDGRWVAPAGAGEQDRAFVPAGGVVDEYGERNATCRGPEGDIDCPQEPEPDPDPTETPDPDPTETETPDPDPTETETPDPDPTETETPDPDPTETETPDPNTTTPAPGHSSPSGGGGGSGGGGSGGGHTSSPSESPTQTAAGEERGRAESRVAASHSRRRYRAPFTLAGSVTGDRTCATTTVEILKRVHGTDEFRTIRTVEVGEDGAWSVRLRSVRSASYAARPSDSDTCDGATSTATDVLVKAKVTTRAVRCRRGARVQGRVRPAYPGTKVRLQRRTPRGWKTIARGRLNDQSRFTLPLRSCRASRVVWPQQDVRNLGAAARVRVRKR